MINTTFDFSIIIILICQVITNGVHTMESFSTCCRSVSLNEPCSTLCENFSISKSSTITIADMKNLTNLCPETQVCIIQGKELIDKNLHWLGRSCCEHAIMPRCQQGCLLSSSTKMLSNHCRQSDEFSLFSCVQTLERNFDCCSNAKSYDCLKSCHDILFNKTIAVRELEDDLQTNCKESNENVINCVFDSINSASVLNRDKFLHCCHTAPTRSCHEACESNLKNSNLTESDIIEILEQKCGTVNLKAEFWKCFLRNIGYVKKNQIIGDLAKLNCCIEKAQTTRCQKMCVNTYSYVDLSLFENFYNECLANFTELSLNQCIEEVDSHVELGCDGLSFCNNFNNRPKELFRNCNKFADIAAKNEYKQWMDSSSLKLFRLDFPIDFHSKSCSALLEVLSCVLHLKPTTRSMHYNQICYDDCIDIIKTCVNKEDRQAIENKICSRLSYLKSPCISLKDYLHEDIEENSLEIKMPCKDHQCNTTTEICEIDRTTNKYFCSKGACQIGENLMVPSNSYVRLLSSMQKGSYKICLCNDGNIDKCHNLPRVPPNSCKIGNFTIDHGSSIEIECNICACFAGEITCTKKQCRFSDMQTSFSSLPCNCPNHYVPVCGNNGKTYQSSCLAKCAGLQETDFEFGSCEDIDPCLKNQQKCSKNTFCYPNKNVCLSSAKNSNICLQYKCIKNNVGINQESSFDERICNKIEIICGINGVTYQSECEAIKDFSMVDYYGNCRAVGFIDAKEPCANVNCPKIPENCIGMTVIPTGACCPKCGSLIKIIYSRKQIDREVYALKSDITLKLIMQSLQKMVKTPSCYVSGFITIETDLIVMIYTILKNPSTSHIEICQEEAVKLTNLIKTRSLHFSLNIGLSSFIVANYIEPINSSSCDFHSSLLMNILTTTVVFLYRNSN